MAFAAVAIVGIVLYQIVARSVGGSIRWADELARLVCIWAIFLGIPALMLRRSLIRIEFFFDLLPPTVQRVLLLLEYGLCFGLLAFLLLSTAKQAAETWDQTSAGLVWPMSFFTLPIAVGAALGLVVMIRMRRQLLTPSPAHGVSTEPVTKELL